MRLPRSIEIQVRVAKVGRHRARAPFTAMSEWLELQKGSAKTAFGFDGL